MDTYTKEFLRFGVVRCAHCGKELNYKPDLPSNFVSLHMGEDGRLCFVNPELVEPYCLNCMNYREETMKVTHEVK